MGQTTNREQTMNKITKYAVAAAVAATIGWSYQANAMTVNWADDGSPFLASVGGTTALPTGDLVEIGSDTANTLAGFTLWSAGLNIDNGIPTTPGGGAYVADGTGAEGSFSDVNAGAGAGFFNAKIYIAIFAAPTAGSSLSTGQGVALVTNPSWTFGANDAAASTIDFTDAGLVVVAGAYDTGTLGDTNLGAPPNLDAVATTAVPEPSSIALVVLGMLGGIGLIRRRR
jgi:hypothetical protein